MLADENENTRFWLWMHNWYEKFSSPGVEEVSDGFNI